MTAPRGKRLAVRRRALRSGHVQFVEGATDCDYMAEGEYEQRASTTLVTIKVLIDGRWHVLAVQVPR